MQQFDSRMEENAASGGVVVAAGLSEFIKGKEASCIEAFEHADRKMHLRKRELKAEPTA